MDNEEWKQIEGYENYEVSNLGRVRNMKRNGKLLNPHLEKIGYYRVDLYKNGKYKHKTVHSLVCKAFVDKPDETYNIIDHINRIKTDNRASNLRWGNFSINNKNKDFTKVTNSRNKSGTTGVDWYEPYKKWRVRISRKTLGYFENFNDAVKCRKDAEQEYFNN